MMRAAFTPPSGATRGCAVPELFAMYLATWDSRYAVEDTSQKTPARTLAESPWTQILAPAVISILGVGAMLWQQSAVTHARLTALESQQAALEARLAQVDRAQLSLEADHRATKEQVTQVRDAMTEIRNYHAATMKEVRDLGVGMARIEGTIKKESRR
jgi:septal ring factor EnvC (AmiA/AmiB activator)